MRSAPLRSAAGGPRSLTRLGLVGLLAAAGVLATAPAAGAHAQLRSSEPADGASIPDPPGEVTLEFTEEPEPGLSSIEVLDAAGGVVSTDEPRFPAPTTVTVPVPDLQEGVYTVTWRVVSRVDGHTTAGAFAFGVGVGPGEVTAQAVDIPRAPPVSVLEIAGRWLLFVGLGLLLGASWTAALAFEEPPRGVIRLSGAAWVASLVGLVLLGAGQMTSAGAAVGPFLGSTVGRAVLYRGGAILVAGIGLLAAGRTGRRSAMVIVGVAVGVAVLVHVAAGHANAYGSGRPLKVLAQWTHVAAAGIWLGGLVAVLLGVRGEPSELKTSVIRRFSRVAGVALGVVLVTGVIRAVNEVPSWGALVTTLYGRLVLVKVGLLVALALLGGINRYRNVPASGRSLRGLRRTSRIELALGAVVLVAAAVMASVIPRPDDRAAARTAPSVTAVGLDFARTVEARLRVSPGTAGVNRFTVRLVDPASGEPVPAGRVALEFTYLGGDGVGSSLLELASMGEGTFRARGTNLSLAGVWQVDLVVQQEADSVEIGLTVGTRCQASAIPGDPTLWNVDTAAGTAQGYIDPGPEGSSEVHITFFAPGGTEMRVEQPTILATPEGGDTIALDPRRLSEGHFVAGAELEEGMWRFDISARGGDGSPVSACFQERIGGS